MAAPPLVVIDSNVLEAAMRSRRGASFALLRLVGTGAFDIALSVPLVLEYEEVLMREAGLGRRNVSRVEDIVDYVCAVGKRQAIFYLWRPCLPDADDDMLLELAVAADCEAIVTHNRGDFGPAQTFGIRVLSPAEFLNQLGDDR